MYHHALAGKCYLCSRSQATSILTKMAAEETLKILVRFSFGERVISGRDNLSQLITEEGHLVKGVHRCEKKGTWH